MGFYIWGYLSLRVGLMPWWGSLSIKKYNDVMILCWLENKKLCTLLASAVVIDFNGHGFHDLLVSISSSWLGLFSCIGCVYLGYSYFYFFNLDKSYVHGRLMIWSSLSFNSIMNFMVICISCIRQNLYTRNIMYYSIKTYFIHLKKKKKKLLILKEAEW